MALLANVFSPCRYWEIFFVAPEFFSLQVPLNLIMFRGDANSSFQASLYKERQKTVLKHCLENLSDRDEHQPLHFPTVFF